MDIAGQTVAPPGLRRLGSLLSGPFRRKPAPDSAHGDPPANAPGLLPVPAADLHLVMNTFNRMAGQLPPAQEAQEERIFLLSDYLRHCLVHLVPAEISVHQERALLDSYLDLVAGFRGWQLAATVTISPDLLGRRLPAHSFCQVVQALLHAWPVDSPGQWTLPVSVLASADDAIALRCVLQPLTPQAPARLKRVRAELRALCRSMARHGRRWSFRAIAGAANAGIAVDVQIR